MEFRSLLIQRNLEPSLVQGKRCHKSADTATSNEHARRSHGLIHLQRQFSGKAQRIIGHADRTANLTLARFAGFHHT
jgi:hypothetical protein